MLRWSHQLSTKEGFEGGTSGFFCCCPLVTALTQNLKPKKEKNSTAVCQGGGGGHTCKVRIDSSLAHSTFAQRQHNWKSEQTSREMRVSKFFKSASYLMWLETWPSAIGRNTRWLAGWGSLKRGKKKRCHVVIHFTVLSTNYFFSVYSSKISHILDSIWTEISLFLLKQCLLSKYNNMDTSQHIWILVSVCTSCFSWSKSPTFSSMNPD